MPRLLTVPLVVLVLVSACCYEENPPFSSYYSGRLVVRSTAPLDSIKIKDHPTFGLDYYQDHGGSFGLDMYYDFGYINKDTIVWGYTRLAPEDTTNKDTLHIYSGDFAQDVNQTLDTLLAFSATRVDTLVFSKNVGMHVSKLSCSSYPRNNKFTITKEDTQLEYSSLQVLQFPEESNNYIYVLTNE